MVIASKSESEASFAPPTPSSPQPALVFISHDSRDAAIADAFAKLLRGATAGMLKSFWSSDKSGAQGLEYGSEWYTEIMKRIDKATDVVCLLTPRSFERPWILYEAGVAKGKLGTPVHGLVLGMPMSTVTGNGPFGQFQNCPSDPTALAGLVLQLAKRIPGCDPDRSIVEVEAKKFLDFAAEELKTENTGKTASQSKPEEEIAAKLFEEVKVMFKELPQQISASLNHDSSAAKRSRRRSTRSIMHHVRFLMETGMDADLIWVSLLGLVRDDIPWIYELGMRAHDLVLKSPSSKLAHKAFDEFRESLYMTTRGPLAEDLGLDRELFYLLEDFTMRFAERHLSEARVRSISSDSKAE